MYNYQNMEAYIQHRQDYLLKEAETVRLLSAGKQSQTAHYGHIVVLIGDTLIAVGTQLKARYERYDKRYEAVNTGAPEPAQGY